jgi:hypothetical protein
VIPLELLALVILFFGLGVGVFIGREWGVATSARLVMELSDAARRARRFPEALALARASGTLSNIDLYRRVVREEKDE